MAKYQKFDELPVWQEAARLYGRVLDLLEEPNTPWSATFRNQLERASLGIANLVAEGFDGVKSADLIWLLSSARGAALEVQSMMGVIMERPKVARHRDSLQQIRTLAESCGRQLWGWRNSVENPNQTRRSGPEGPEAPRGGPAVESTPSAGRSGTRPPASGARAPS
jgi:four helix bundle protein